MNKRELGKSGLLVSEIGLGCMSLPLDKHAAKKIVDYAIDQGISYFDTADLYQKGVNEEVVGYAIKENRQHIKLATKVGNTWTKEGTKSGWNSSKPYIMNQVKESLLRLQTDYIDLYQLHGGTMEDNLEESIDAFDSLKKEGLIRSYGISSIRPSVINRFLSNSEATSVMMQYSLLDRRPEEWLNLISNHGASIVTRGTLAKGLLTAEAMKRAEGADGYGAYRQEALITLLAKLRELTPDLHSLAIAFVLQHHQVSSILAGASSVHQLKNTILAHQKSISYDQIMQVKKLLRNDKYEQHRI